MPIGAILKAAGKVVNSAKAYNARKRYTRAARRYLNKAHDSVGVTRERYETLARENLEKAAMTYTRRANINRSKEFTRLASELNINVQEYMPGAEPTEREMQRLERVISESTESLAGRMSISERREAEAQAILSGPVGSRIYAGLVDVWSKPQFDASGQLINTRTQENINDAIMKHFGVSSMMDVIEILEKQVDLYADPKSQERYDEISMQIQIGLYR